MSVVVDELLRGTFSCFGASRVSNFHNRGINLRNPYISFSDFYLLNVGMSGSSYSKEQFLKLLEILQENTCIEVSF